jgi:MFS superfamily sulfate permease-like transporter
MEFPILELKTPWPLVNVEEDEGELVVRFHSDAFLWPAVDEVGQILLSLVDETDGGPFVLDFGNVDRVSGIGLEKLVRLNRKLAARGGRLAVRNAGSELRERLPELKDVSDASKNMPLGGPWHGHDCPQELESDT